MRIDTNMTESRRKDVTDTQRYRFCTVCPSCMSETIVQLLTVVSELLARRDSLMWFRSNSQVHINKLHDPEPRTDAVPCVRQ